MNGRIAVGWLVVEDLAMVLVLVLLPPLAGRARVANRGQRQHRAAVVWTIGQTCCRSPPSSR
jgi:CPA2 family monovalent cation:H+ antiporter-2